MRLPLYEPMLATRWEAPFDSPDWWFEVKWDGYRAIVGSEEDGIWARSRRGLNLLDAFPEIGSLELAVGVVVDGEIAAFDHDGKPSFALLQRRTGFGGAGTGARVGVNLVVFDLLYRGEDLTGRPIEERRSMLADLELASPMVVPEPTLGAGTSLYQAVVDQGLEGMVAKRAGSAYQPGRRSADWRKISVRHKLRAVVGGYLPGEGGRSGTFGSLLVGLYAPQGLRWVGAVGSGFDDASLHAFHDALKELERPTRPFVNEVVVGSEPVWVEPGIVIVVEYKEWTLDNHLRAPVYKGIELADPETITWAEEA